MTTRSTGLLALLALCSAADPPLVEGQPRPVVERIEPTSGPPGVQLEIIGRRIHPSSHIFLGRTELPVVRRLPNRWTVTVPAGAGTGRIVIATPFGRFNGPEFRVVSSRPAPTVETLEPAQGPPGSEITLRGQNFSPRLTDNTVLLSGRPAVVRSATPTMLTVIVPAGVTSGPFVVRVANAGEGTSPAFAVMTGTAVSDFRPRIGPPGSIVAIAGAGFSTTPASNRVFLNNVPVPVQSATPTELVVRIPDRAASGTLLVDVAGSGRAQTPTPFVIQHPPTIRSFTPAAGPPATVVTLRGSNFGTDVRALSVTLGGRPVVVRSLAPTTIVGEVPVGVSSGRLAVTVHGLGPAEARTDFTVLEPVAIRGFEPRTGPVGTVVLVRGAGFSAVPAQNTVTVSGTRAEVVSASANELRVRVPASRSGTFDVTVAGNGQARSTAPFVITQPPVVVTFEPAGGTVGSDVVIRGSHFGDNPGLVAVTIGGRPMPLRSLADDRIVVRVPAAATDDHMVVSVRMQGAVSSPEVFRVLMPFSIASVDPSEGFVGSELSIRGVGLVAGTIVSFGSVQATPLSITPTELRVVVPRRASTGPVTIRLPDGRTLATESPFTVTPTPPGVGITSMSPQCYAAGCSVTIRGHGFGRRARLNRIAFGSTAVRVDRATPTELVITLPAAPGTEPFRIQVRGQREALTAPFTIVP